MIRKSRIRLVSPWTRFVETETAIFSAEFASGEADALLCEWAPSEELFSFPGPKAWYCCEPECQFRGIGNGRWPELRACLAANEFLSHGHGDPRYRVPHVTHSGSLEINQNPDRLGRAVAVVSNFGGGPRKRHPQIQYRNRFVTHPLVDLYGRLSWQKYRKSLFSLPKVPGNYKGGIPGDWPAGEKRELLARYKVCLCLENMNEPHYFTEKFVEAVTAGCIPVYRAHESLVKTVLKGAMWVDPAEYGDDPQKTIDAALGADLLTYQVKNLEWLESTLVKESCRKSVFEKIEKILFGKF